MKICSKCGPKPEPEFSKKGPGRLQPYCKACQKEYKDEHYRKNRKTYITKARIQKKNVAAFAQSLKVGKPCADCHIVYPPYVMDWDHRPGEKKVDNVSQLKESGSLKKILAEIAKCDLVCANCHRERTHQRL